MNNQTKMIIITSDEDVIRQVASNQSTNTQIIDLDQIKTNSSYQTDDDIFISLALLAKLPQSNSNNVKRSLDSSDQNSSKKSMICAICGDRAIGYNYDVLSCGSCKAFFRRNAHHNPTKVRCLMGEDQCSVEHSMSRKCQKCRLKRCLEMGMRKDFLLSEETKQKRRKRTEENQKITTTRLTTAEVTPNPPSVSPLFDEIDRLMEDLDDDLIVNENADLLFGTLSIEDWTIIENLKCSFLSFFEVPEMHHPPPPPMMQLSDHYTAFLNWSNVTNKLSLLFINFFRQIPEFEELPLDDRVRLIKYNLFPSFPICKCYHQEKESDIFSLIPNLEGQRRRQLFLSSGISIDTFKSVMNVVNSLVQITERDVKLLSLLLVIVFFIPGLSMSEEEPPLKDPIGLNRAQSHYTKVLWNYLINQYGDLETHRRFIGLIGLILRLQSAANSFRSFFRQKCVTLNAIDQMTPLVQTVLNLSSE